MRFRRLRNFHKVPRTVKLNVPMINVLVKGYQGLGNIVLSHS